MNSKLRRILSEMAPETGGTVNQYKRQDVFRCTHEAHAGFENAVSVYHVLKVKGCFPQGCISFKWKCKKIDGAQKCHRKFKYVGRACASCRYFYDIKVMNRPRVALSPGAYQKFQRDFRSFETWLDGHRGRLVEFSGQVNSIKPRYSLGGPRLSRVHFEGFLLNFRQGYINAVGIDDFVYMTMSARLQQRHALARGDVLACHAHLALRDGALVLQNPRGIGLEERQGPCFWTVSRAIVAQKTGTILPRQAQACYECDKGILLSARHDGATRSGEARRRMFCLEGVPEPGLCCYRLRGMVPAAGPGREGLHAGCACD